MDINRQNKREFTALMCAAEKGNVPLVVLLLGLQARVYVRGENGETALICAVVNNKLDLVKLLLSDYRVREQIDVETTEFTALISAARSGYVEIIDELIKGCRRREGGSSWLYGIRVGSILWSCGDSYSFDRCKSRDRSAE